MKRAEKALSRITDDDALAKVVLDERVLTGIRNLAMERINDDMVIVQLLFKASDQYLYPISIWQRGLPLIHSKAATEVMKEYALRDVEVDGYWGDNGIRFLRGLDDTECLLRAVKLQIRQVHVASDSDEVEQGWSEIANDIIRLKQMGVDTVMLADDLYEFSKDKKRFMPLLWSVDLIQKNADDKNWIETIRRIAPEDMVRQAFAGQPDEAEKLALYQIPDGIVHKSKCDFGIHDYVLDHEEREVNPDDYNRDDVCYYYRCSRCGKICRKFVDGFGREHWSDR